MDANEADFGVWPCLGLKPDGVSTPKGSSHLADKAYRTAGTEVSFFPLPNKPHLAHPGLAS
jgi:hypothetical protein